MQDKFLTYDYSRSFIQWDSQRDNVPRCTVHASCRLRAKDGTEREFFLGHPCAGEQMYLHRNIIHQPVADFHVVCEPGKEYMMVKVHAEEPVEQRMPHRVGEVVATKDGLGARITRVDVTMRHFPSVRELQTDRAVAEAMRANLPIMGRTRYLAEEAGMEVVTEYPVTVMNARPSDDRWQVDTGPVLVPDFSLTCELTVGKFRQAFLVFNARDWAEFAVRQPIPVSGSGRVCVHFAPPRGLTVTNQLFAADL